VRTLDIGASGFTFLEDFDRDFDEGLGALLFRLFFFVDNCLAIRSVDELFMLLVNLIVIIMKRLRLV